MTALPATNARVSRGLRRASSLLLPATLFLLLTLSGVAAAAPDPSAYTLFWGSDRYGTAIQISKAGWPGESGSPYAVVASGADFPDALAAGPLAGIYQAPLLLTVPTGLDARVTTELQRLNAKTIFAVGLGYPVQRALRAALPSANVVASLGRDRYQTAALVAAQIKKRLGAVSKVVVAPGDKFPDGLAVVPVASRNGWPLLLTPASGPFNPTSAAAIKSLGASRALVVGSWTRPTGISAANTSFIAGVDRYDTSARIAEYSIKNGCSFSHVGLATGESFANALAVAPRVAKAGGILLLTRGAEVPLQVGNELFVHQYEVKRVDFVALLKSSLQYRVKGLLGQPNLWTWVSEPPALAPPARDNALMLYNPVVDRVLLFGGNNALGADTWSYSVGSNRWTNLNPRGAVPSARFAPGAAVVLAAGTRANGKVIMFGGASKGVLLNDTWLFDPVANSWTEVIPTNPNAATLPPPRLGQAMDYDPVSGRVLMFGGWDGNRYKLFDDLWAYDPVANTWTQLMPQGPKPPPRDGQAFARDERGGKLVMFGGVGYAADGSLTALNDTWAYDPVTNTWTALAPANRPTLRDGMPMVYDPAGGMFLLFGGGNNGGEVRNDTWAYDPVGNTWMNLNPPGWLPDARMNHNMAFDTKRGKLILFGGAHSYWSSFLGDTWVYTPAATPEEALRLSQKSQ